MSYSDEHLLSPHENLHREIMAGSLKGYNAVGILKRRHGNRQDY